MGIRDFFLARRLRKGPTLFLPYVPEPGTVLNTVRLLHPQAFGDARAISAGEGVELRGPIDATPALEARVGLSRPWRVAYVAAVAMAVDRPRYGPQHVVEGLSRRLRGHPHPGMPHPTDAPAHVYRSARITEGRLMEVLAEVLPDLEVTARFDEGDEDEEVMFASPTSPIEIDVRRGPGHDEYSIEVDDYSECPADVVELAEHVAVLIAEEGGGVACDHTLFPLRAGEVTPAAPPRPV